jgi:ABC-type multidrug transport system ATPase subunit
MANSYTIRAIEVSKAYRRRRRPAVVALERFSVDVPQGCVYGLIGPNGSGKTTFIRSLLGLTKIDGGSVELLGARVPDALPEVIDRVGITFEEPSVFPGFTGARNLDLLAEMRGIPRSRVEEALRLVGLEERGADRVQTYSFGMRQRLALAATLLKAPELVILDEPTNGLDPSGIVELRRVIRRLRERGLTVFLATHLLVEAEQLCDYVAIISRGSCLTSGRIDEVAAASRALTCVRVSDLQVGGRALKAAGFDVMVRGDHLVVPVQNDKDRISATLAAEGVTIRGLWDEAPTLESVFMELTGHARAARHCRRRGSRTSPANPAR